MPLRQVQIHRVLWRPRLILGGERKLVLMLMVVSVALPMQGQNLSSAVVSGALWLIGLPTLQRMAKSDTQMSEVYLRHVKYQRYYPARSRPYRNT